MKLNRDFRFYPQLSRIATLQRERLGRDVRMAPTVGPYPSAAQRRRDQRNGEKTMSASSYDPKAHCRSASADERQTRLFWRFLAALHHSRELQAAGEINRHRHLIVAPSAPTVRAGRQRATDHFRHRPHPVTDVKGASRPADSNYTPAAAPTNLADTDHRPHTHSGNLVLEERRCGRDEAS